MADAGEGSVDTSTERSAAAREPMSLPERRFSGCQRLGNLNARAALVSCRGGQVLDEIVGGLSPFGGAQRPFHHGQLVDHADERSRSHRWPDGEDSHAHHASFALGDDNRRRGNEEQVTQVVGVVARGSRIGAIVRQQADGSIEIGQTGASDVNLQGAPSQRGLVAIRSGCAAGQPPRGYHARPELIGQQCRRVGTGCVYILRSLNPRGYDAAI